VLISLFAGHAYAAAAVKAMHENVLDFLLKPVNPEDLLGLVARAYVQYYDVDWDFVGEDLEFIEDSLNRITIRLREVLDLLDDGYTSRKNASLLDVSIKTIEAHRARINDKMRSDDLAHLVRMVLVAREKKTIAVDLMNRSLPGWGDNLLLFVSLSRESFLNCAG
jgi:two-component system response regulator FixJ